MTQLIHLPRQICRLIIGALWCKHIHEPMVIVMDMMMRQTALELAYQSGEVLMLPKKGTSCATRQEACAICKSYKGPTCDPFRTWLNQIDQDEGHFILSSWTRPIDYPCCPERRCQTDLVQELPKLP
jgi:hypothetical protein